MCDKYVIRDLLENTRQAGGGILAGTAGAPVDIATMLMRPAGYKVPDKNVVGSSEHIAGLLGLDTGSTPYKVASLMPTDAGDLMKYGGLIGAVGKDKFAAKMAEMPKPKPDYGGEHRPMRDDGGAARLDDLTASFPPDVYGPNALRYYGSGDVREAGVLKMLHSLRGKPDAEVTIYRGVPKGGSKQINEGDWVTLDRNVASDYGEVVSKKVKAKDVTSWADSLLEFGYFPKK